jgi:dipeptidyl aminopeptidase/acylaminoacyl peptidase
MAVVTSAPLLSVKAAEAADPPAQGKIVIYAQFIQADQPGGQEWGLFVVDPMTDKWSKLAGYPVRNGIAEMSDLRVSPDGSCIAFNRYEDRHTYARANSVWIQDIRPGATARKISDIGGRPIWSPDGKHVLVVEPDGGTPESPFEPAHSVTWKIERDGSHPVRLPVPDTDQISDWSSDGQWLVGVSPRSRTEPDRGFDNVIMHTDGSGRRPLPGPGVGWRARFSPDAKRIAYVTASNEPGRMTGKSIWVMDIDGTNRRAIYKEPGQAYLEDAVAWSPDGKQLAVILQTWTRTNNGGLTPKNPRLCLINVEDRQRRFVPHPPAAVLGHPEWR